MTYKNGLLSFKEHLDACGLTTYTMAEKAGVSPDVVAHACRRGKVAESKANAMLKVLSAEFGRPITKDKVEFLETV